MCKLFQEYNTLAKLLWVALLYVVSAGPVFILFVINNLLYNFKNPSSAPIRKNGIYKPKSATKRKSARK
ncbi:hypothetical protein PQ469_16280 [Mucilaginibacter sp. KACC 22773]|uniref:hypothetical protein n=1 Tax=Mucilaginibacter sp. KACC 22773 TaxID=3025671 RepID=UPI0023654228|nr:hypothetical protein [Mucilaginibacter sp. KACC 22773]WDF75448.1 hypothetical protein PQ469_16280 [Mucilaginibacter sp. KACC 22773]